MIDQDLLDKFYRGECTEAEVRQILSMFNNPQAGKKHIEDLWKAQSSTEVPPVPDSGKRLAAIRQRLGLTKRDASRHNVWLPWVRAAAVLVVAFLLSLLIIKSHSDMEEATEQYITKENPAGRKSTVSLPDGTIVNLNAESRITFPENFNDSIRTVSLVGEAFFQVAENKERPFIVSCSGINTQALGTSFNIKGYEEDQQVQVILASGSVKVTSQGDGNDQEVFLSPGEAVQVAKQTHAMRKQTVDLYSTLAWKDNIIVFHQAPATQVFATLERWYGVTFTFADKSSNESWSFTGEFRNESLENILESISYIKDFHYQINQKSIIIHPKPK